MFGKKKDEIPEEPVRKEEIKKTRISWFPIGLALAFILLGALLIFIPTLTPLHLCYVLDGIAIALGIIFIVRYFMTESYKNTQRYGFSLGTVLLLFGAIGLVKAQALSAYLLTLIGALLLVAAVLKLQNALDLKFLKDDSWIIWLMIAIVFGVLATLALLNPFGDSEKLEVFSQVVLLIDGIVSLIGTLFLYSRIRRSEKGEEIVPEKSEPPEEIDVDEPPVEVIRPDEDDEKPVRMNTPGIQEDFDAGIDD